MRKTPLAASPRASFPLSPGPRANMITYNFSSSFSLSPITRTHACIRARAYARGRGEGGNKGKEDRYFPADGRRRGPREQPRIQTEFVALVRSGFQEATWRAPLGRGRTDAARAYPATTWPPRWPRAAFLGVGGQGARRSAPPIGQNGGLPASRSRRLRPRQRSKGAVGHGRTARRRAGDMEVLR